MEESLTYSKGWRAEGFDAFGGNRSHCSLSIAFLQPEASWQLLTLITNPAPSQAHPHCLQVQDTAHPCLSTTPGQLASFSSTPASSEALLPAQQTGQMERLLQPRVPQGQELQDEVRQEEVGAVCWREGQLGLFPGAGGS